MAEPSKAWGRAVDVVSTLLFPFREMLDVPMTRSEGERDTGVPEMVTPGPPGDRVVPAMAKPAGRAVNICPPTVKTEECADEEEEKAILLVPMTTPDGFSETGVPEMVMPGPPGTSVVPAIGRAVGFAVNVCPPKVKTARAVGLGTAMRLVPTMRPEGPRDMGMPEIETAGAPR